MTDHSTSVSHTQTATAGGGATIIQIFGDNNSVSGPKPVLHVHAPSPEPPSPQSLEQDVNTAAMLQPGQESTAFIGRNDLIDGFQHWATTHHADKPVSVRVLHGKAGVGKTRFGLELCRRLNATAWPTNGHESSLAWKAGFVSSDEAIRFMNQTNLVDWGWNTPTLLVFDYALTMADVLKKWLAQLCTVRTSRFPLRIILLERHADKDSGWLERVFASGFIGIAPHGPSALLDTAPIRLPGLNDITAQRAILQAMLDRLRSTVSLPADDDTLKTILHKTDWTAAPLYLMMAAMVMHEQGGLHHILSLRRTDLAMKIAEHERKRFTHGLHEESASTTFLCHIAAFATLCGGIASEHVKHIIQQEKEQLVFDSVDTAMLTTHIKQILPGEDNGIAPIQPDIVGEAFVLCNLANHDETGSTKAAISAFDYAPRATAVSLIRTIQDFASTTGGTPPQEQTRALHWIEAVGNREDLPLPMLQELVASLPDDTHALRVQAAAWQERIVKHVQLVTPNPARGWLRRLLTLFRKKNRNEILSQAEFARNLQNLAVRYGDLGRHQQALEASEEAVTIYRELAQAMPDAFRPNLAMSLNNLSGELSALGRHQQALEASEEAVKLYRSLAQAMPDAFRPDLAASLNNLSNRFSALGRHQQALEASEEAVTIRRELAQAMPDAFRPDLAMSLNNLSNRFSALGRHQQALEASKEAVKLYRSLAQAMPDAFRPYLAMSLNNLSNRLSALGRHQQALEASEEAVKLYRSLAQAMPDAFRPDLAMSLNNLSTFLSALGRHQQALEAIEEAVTIRRELAQAMPDAFRPKLAMSLNNLSGELSALGRHQQALEAIKEAVTIRRELAQAMPDAFRPDLAASLNNLSTFLSALGRHQQALEVAHESAFLYLQLVQQLPEAYGQNFGVAFRTWLHLHCNISREEASRLLQDDFDACIDEFLNTPPPPSWLCLG